MNNFLSLIMRVEKCGLDEAEKILQDFRRQVNAGEIPVEVLDEAGFLNRSDINPDEIQDLLNELEGYGSIF